jgi:Spy/CpxP family protein refolding chaperone
MTKRVMAVAAALIVMMLSGSLMAGYHGAEKAKGQCKGMEWDLTDEQHVAIEKLGLELRLKNMDLEMEQKKLHLEVKQELLKDEPSRKAIDAIAEKMAVLQSKLHKNKIDHLMAVRKVLNADQWKHFIEKHHAMKGSHGGCTCGCCGGHAGMGCRCGHGGCHCKGMGCGMHGNEKGGGCGGAEMHHGLGTCARDGARTAVRPCMEK